MTKDEFLGALTHRLGYLPYEEVKKSTDFYREAIDDRMEDGMTEEEAVAAMGDLDGIAHEIEQTLPLAVIVKERVKTEREKVKRKKETASDGTKTLWIVLTILGAPLWIGLLCGLVGGLIGVIAAVFAVSISLFVVAVSLIVSGAMAVGGSVFLPYPGVAPRLMLSGAGLAVIGLGTLLIPPAKLVSQGIGKLVKSFVKAVKRLILGKKEAVS